MSAALSIKGLSAGYGGIRVLEKLDLEVPRDEITVVVGPNGAGKTTLLRRFRACCRAPATSASTARRCRSRRRRSWRAAWRNAPRAGSCSRR